MEKRGKSFDGLMRHIRNSHNIEIRGSEDKKRLVNIGYYHGYKGYKFNKDVAHPFIGIHNFEQIVAIANFDQQMKTIFYPITIKFETIIKNLIVNYSVLGIDPSFDNVYRQKLTFYRSQRGRRRTKSINKRLRLKKDFDSEIAYAYASNNIVIKHYIEENKSVPLWALFEVISLGNVGSYVACLNREDKEKVADFLNLYNSQYDENVKILEQSIFLIKDLRNAVAHNHIIFDCRFRKAQNVAQNLKATVKNKLHLEAETNFDILFDYLALLMIFLKESGNSRSELNSYITDFENSVNILYKSTEEIAHNKEPLPYSVYNLIIGERFKLKLNKLKEYIN